MGVLGLAKMHYASYLILVTRRSHVITLPHGTIYRVSGTELRPVGSEGLSDADPRRLIEYRLVQVRPDFCLVLLALVQFGLVQVIAPRSGWTSTASFRLNQSFASFRLTVLAQAGPPRSELGPVFCHHSIAYLNVQILAA